MDLSIVTNYLDEYSGKKYSSPEKSTGVEKEYYTAFYNAGKLAREEYKKYCRAVCDGASQIEMDGDSPSRWVNQGQVVDEYFWSRFKTSISNKYDNNISITINRLPALSDSWILGVYVGAEYKKASDDTAIIRRQNHLLDLDIPESNNFYYLVDTTYNTTYTTKNRDEVREKYIDNKVKVVSLLKVIDGPYSIDRSDTIIKDSRQAVKEFIPYYEYIMSENYTMSGWQENKSTIHKLGKKYEN